MALGALGADLFCCGADVYRWVLFEGTPEPVVVNPKSTTVGVVKGLCRNVLTYKFIERHGKADIVPHY